METLNSNNENILVIQTAFIGDAILTLPMIERLKELNPKAEVDVLAIPLTKEIFESSPYVTDIIVMDKKGEHKSFRKLKNVINQLKLRSYKKVYSPHRSFRSAYIILCLRVSESYGFDNSSLKYVYKNVIKYEPKFHEVQRNLALIDERTESDDWRVLPKIIDIEDDINEISIILSSNKIDTKFITVAPSSVWNTKQYPKEYFVKLVEMLLQVNETVILIGGKSDQLLCDEIALNFSQDVFNLAGRLSIPATIQLLKLSKLLITNDSAPTHMGMCADIPVLTIYCSTIPGFGFYPYNKKSTFISYDDLYCKPCGIHGYQECPLKTFDCAFKLLPEKIFDEVQKLLSRNKVDG